MAWLTDAMSLLQRREKDCFLSHDPPPNGPKLPEAHEAATRRANTEALKIYFAGGHLGEAAYIIATCLGQQQAV